MTSTLKQSKTHGVITIELLIAFAVLLINLTGILLLTSSGQSLAVDTDTNTEALAKAEEEIEKTKNLAQFDFNLINPANTTDGIYQKSLVVEQLDIFTKRIESTVSWLVEGGRAQNIKLTTLISNPEAVSGGDTCSSILSGDWANSIKTEYEFGRDILNDTSSGFPISSIQTFNKKMYVTVNNTNGNNPGTFFILDIANPAQKPILLSPSNFDNSSVGEGLNSVAVDGAGYAYVASAYTSASGNCIQAANCAQLQVISLANPANPQVVKNLKLNSITSGNKLTSGTVVAYQNDVVYLGTTRAGNAYPEFFTIDVSNPTNPQVLDSFKIGNGINSILVRNGYAYVASPHSEELKILDVSDPSDITYAGGFDAPGGGGNNGNGKSLYAVGNKIYFGRTLLTGDEFYVLNNANPNTNLPSLGSKNILVGGNNSSVNGVLVRDTLAFLITSGEFQIWNIANPASITQHANPLTLPPGSGGGLQGTASDCEGNYIFVGSKSSNDKGYISIITAQ